jgi:putative phosphoribosyl transferase
MIRDPRRCVPDGDMPQVTYPGTAASGSGLAPMPARARGSIIGSEMSAVELDRLTIFADRRDAGRRLAAALADERHADAVVVGLARGGVVVAAEVARALHLPLDALAVRKIGHPFEPEYALGAVTPGDGVYVRDIEGQVPAHVQVWVDEARRRARDLDARLHAERPSVPLAGRRCLLVDDGLATGATMIAAVRYARAAGAARVVACVPVGAAETVAAVATEADRVVGMWYDDFRQVSDEDVVALLAEALPEAVTRRSVGIRADAVTLPGDLAVPTGASGVVVFAHGSGSGRFSPRNRQVARALNRAGLATLLLDLLTEEEELERRFVFDIDLLTRRLVVAARWVASADETRELPLGFFGASTGAAAALLAAAELPDLVRAVVSRGGRPDLAAPRLAEVRAGTLLIVGGADETVLELNREALAALRCERRLEVVPGATHLFEEPGALERVAELAGAWFLGRLTPRAAIEPG